MPQIVIVGIFIWITNFYDNITDYLVFYFTILLISLCAQNVSQNYAIIFPDNSTLALMITTFTHLLILFLGNCLVPLKELHYSLQILSSISYIRLGFESIVIIIYGFDRCSEDQISTVLYFSEVQTFGQIFKF